METVETVVPNASPTTLTLPMDSLNGAPFFQAISFDAVHSKF